MQPHRLCTTQYHRSAIRVARNTRPVPVDTTTLPPMSWSGQNPDHLFGCPPDRRRLKRFRRSQEKSSTLATKTTPPIIRTQTTAERVPTKESTSKNRKAKRNSRIPIHALPPRRPMP
jgi:hypothetical protein